MIFCCIAILLLIAFHVDGCLKKPVRRLGLLAACLFSFCTTFSQYEELLHKPYAERAPYLWKIGGLIHEEKDSARAFAMAGRLIDIGRKNKDAALQLEGELYNVFYLTRYFPHQEERITTTLHEIIHRAVDTKSKEVEWKARHVLANYFYDRHSFEAAFEEYNELHRQLQSVTFAVYPDKMNTLYYIGTAYFNFEDYPKAIQYYSQNPPLLPLQHFQYTNIHSVNNIAISYQRLGQLDSADHYTNLLYRYAVDQKDSVWMGITKGNLGQSEYLRGRYEQAIPLLKACIDQAIKVQDWNLAAGSLMPLADIYFNQHKIADAEAVVLQAKDFIERNPYYDRYSTLYPLLAKMYAYKGNPELSTRYLDSAAFVKDSIHRKFSGLLLARALQKDALAQQKAKMADIENRKQLLTVKFYAFLVIAALAFVITIFIYRNKRLKHKQEQVLKDLTLKEKEKQLAVAQEQLLDFAHHLAEKNELIQQLEARNGNGQVIQELEQTVILTGKDWGRFRELFEQVHPGYLGLLTQKIPGITPAEIRLMALAKLNFSNKEMAASLGVTPQAIRVTWHRLRKKSGLQEEGTIEELVNSIM